MAESDELARVTKEKALAERDLIRAQAAKERGEAQKLRIANIRDAMQALRPLWITLASLFVSAGAVKVTSDIREARTEKPEQTIQPLDRPPAASDEPTLRRVEPPVQVTVGPQSDDGLSAIQREKAEQQLLAERERQLAEKKRAEKARAEQKRRAEEQKIEQQRLEQAKAEKIQADERRAEQHRLAEKAEAGRLRAEQARTERAEQERRRRACEARCGQDFDECRDQVPTIEQCVADRFPNDCLDTCMDQFGHGPDECVVLCQPTPLNVRGWRSACRGHTERDRKECQSTRDECINGC